MKYNVTLQVPVNLRDPNIEADSQGGEKVPDNLFPTC